MCVPQHSTAQRKLVLFVPVVTQGSEPGWAGHRLGFAKKPAALVKSVQTETVLRWWLCRRQSALEGAYKAYRSFKRREWGGGGLRDIVQTSETERGPGVVS